MNPGCEKPYKKNVTSSEAAEVIDVNTYLLKTDFHSIFLQNTTKIKMWQIKSGALYLLENVRAST